MCMEYPRMPKMAKGRHCFVVRAWNRKKDYITSPYYHTFWEICKQQCTKRSFLAIFIRWVIGLSLDHLVYHTFDNYEDAQALAKKLHKAGHRSPSIQIFRAIGSGVAIRSGYGPANQTGYTKLVLTTMVRK